MSNLQQISSSPKSSPEWSTTKTAVIWGIVIICVIAVSTAIVLAIMKPFGHDTRKDKIMSAVLGLEPATRKDVIACLQSKDKETTWDDVVTCVHDSVVVLTTE